MPTFRTYGPRRKGFALTLVIVALAAGACSSEGAERREGRTLTEGGVPVSGDPPIPFGSPVAAPHEASEVATGAIVYVVDAPSRSVYRLDLGRQRLLGPAPRVTVFDEARGSRVESLPGFPWVTGAAPPQSAAIVGGTLFVGAGEDGELIAFPISRPGPPRRVSLPAPQDAGSNFVKLVQPTPGGDVVAIASDVVRRRSIAYVVDVETLRVTDTRTLPASPLAVASGSGRLAATFGQGNVLEIMDERLRSVRRIVLPGQAMGLGLVDRRTAVVSVGDAPENAAAAAASLLAVDFESGRVRVLQRSPGKLVGPVIVHERGILWALPELEEVRFVSLDGAVKRSLTVCRAVKHLEVVADFLVASCHADGDLALVDMVSGHTKIVPAGGFTSDIVGPEKS